VLKYFLHALLLCVVLAWGPASARAQDASKEYLVKAAFLYNFVKFVEWPAERAVAQQSTLNICVIGSNPFDDAARQIFAKASTASLRLSLVGAKRSDDLAGSCHIVFIARSEEGGVSEILASLKGKPVLTVSDAGGFVNRGGMVGFVSHDNKIKLAINTVNATAAGLRMDAQLLEIALEVIRK
jgi:YfiR/HmsC-like